MVRLFEFLRYTGSPPMAITELFFNDCGDISRKGNRESFNPGVENTLTQAKGRAPHAIELYLLVN